jgi:hypothetical protein
MSINEQNTEITVSPGSWANVYWFARMLINTDQYGGLGKNSLFLENFAADIQEIYQTATLEETGLIKIKQCLQDTLLQNARNKPKRTKEIAALATDLSARLNTFEDVAALIFTCLHVMIPINEALANIPNSDKEFAEVEVKKHLQQQGEKALSRVINMWDTIGIEGSINAERTQIAAAYRQFQHTVATQYPDLSNVALSYLVTAFVQEFERRAAQKRKSRAGGSLEDVTSLILSHFGIPTTHQPEHFQADIEVDKWVATADHWLIGISCKRTLRERWKQVSSADYGVMSRYKIKEIWHVITYSQDLSEDKLVTLGAGRQYFYLPDESSAYLEFSQHPGMARYVRPMSQFIQDLVREVGVSRRN